MTNHHCRECMGTCELLNAAYERGRRAAIDGPRNDAAGTARNRDEAQDIIMASEEALGQCFDAATRHDLAGRITEALDAATSSPAPAESDPVVLDEHLIALCDEHARIESAAYVYGCALLGAAERAGLVANGVNSTNRGRQQKQFIGEVIKHHLSLEQIDPPESDASWEATLVEYRQQINAMESDIAAPPDTTRVAGERRLLTPEELADIERFQQQRRKSPVPTDAWLYVAEIDRLLTHIRLDREQLENEIFQDATDPNFAAAPNDNDAK